MDDAHAKVRGREERIEGGGGGGGGQGGLQYIVDTVCEQRYLISNAGYSYSQINTGSAVQWDERPDAYLCVCVSLCLSLTLCLLCCRSSADSGPPSARSSSLASSSATSGRPLWWARITT